MVSLSNIKGLCRFFWVLSAVVLAAGNGFCQSGELSPEARGRFSSEAEESGSLTYSPYQLEGGSSLTLISPKKLNSVASRLAEPLESTHRMFTRLLGTLPPVEVSLRLMEEDLFFSSTGAPRWTNALFYRGQIMIPVASDYPPDMDNIARSIRHEYTHAVVSAISKGKCPGWLDEGLAQWAEGPENPGLRASLSNFLHKNPPVPFSMLQNGFTKLEKPIVAPAYAQSLIAVHALTQTFGFAALRNYLNHLGNDTDKDKAFRRAFQLNESDFEERLGLRMVAWARSTQKNRESKSEPLQVVLNYR